MLNETHIIVSGITGTGPTGPSTRRLNCFEFYNVIEDYHEIYLDTLQLERDARNHEKHGYADSVFLADQSQLSEIAKLAISMKKYNDTVFNLTGVNVTDDCSKSQDFSEYIKKANKLQGM